DLPPQKNWQTAVVALKRAVRQREGTYVTITHFDCIQQRHNVYDRDLWSSLRHLVVEDSDHPLILLILSRVPFAQLLPPGSALSLPDSLAMFETVRLQ